MHWIAATWDVTWSFGKFILMIVAVWGMFIWLPRKIYRRMRKAAVGAEYGGFTDEYGQYVAPMSRESWIEYKRVKRQAEGNMDRERRAQMRW